MTLRDDLLPVVDACRKITQDLGQRTTSLTIRQRVWTSGVVGKRSGTLLDYSDFDTVFPARYHIADLSVREVSQIITTSGGTFQPGQYVKLWVTPEFPGGGYTQSQLVPTGTDDATEILYVLSGGLNGNYRLVSFGSARPYRYELILRAQNDTPPP